MDVWSTLFSFLLPDEDDTSNLLFILPQQVQALIPGLCQAPGKFSTSMLFPACGTVMSVSVWDTI